MKIAVYTANFNQKDILKSPLNYVKDEVDYYAFVDDYDLDIVSPYTSIFTDLKLDDITKNARKLKILGHKILNDYDITIWHDSNIQLDAKRLKELINVSVLNKTFVTTFRHPHRDDFYSEAMACVRVSKDNHFKILKQVLYSFYNGVPAHDGLYSSGIFIKNNQYLNENFLSLWWKTTLRFSRRDQLSLAYTIYKTKQTIGIIKGDIFKNKYSVYNNHRHQSYVIRNQDKTSNRLKIVSFYSIKLIRKLRKLI